MILRKKDKTRTLILKNLKNYCIIGKKLENSEMSEQEIPLI